MDSKIVQYLSVAQPYLEKLADEKKVLLASLSTHLQGLVKQGSISKQTSEKIYKEAEQNTSSIVRYLGIGKPPISSFGRVVPYNKNGLGKEIDPITAWVNS